MQNNSKKILNVSSFDTNLGKMIAAVDEHFLYLLEFENCKNLDNKFNKLKKKYDISFETTENQVVSNLRQELINYFNGSLVEFKTPIKFIGSVFQKKVWDALLCIPFGDTFSYRDIANSIKNTNAFRAVANANAMNSLAIIVPCHRVVRANSNLGGYAGGIEKKQFLINHEKSIKNKVT